MYINPRVLIGGTMLYGGGYLAALADHPTWYNYAGVAIAGIGWSIVGVFRKDRG